MAAAELDPADQAVLRSGDPAAINMRIAGGPERDGAGDGARRRRSNRRRGSRRIGPQTSAAPGTADLPSDPAAADLSAADLSAADLPASASADPSANPPSADLPADPAPDTTAADLPAGASADPSAADLPASRSSRSRSSRRSTRKSCPRSIRSRSSRSRSSRRSIPRSWPRCSVSRVSDGRERHGRGIPDRRRTGIRTVGQLTVESIAWIQRADRVLYVIGDPVAEAMITKLNPEGAESLSVMYAENKSRLQTYEGSFSGSSSACGAACSPASRVTGAPRRVRLPLARGDPARAGGGLLRPACCRASRRRIACSRTSESTLVSTGASPTKQRTSSRTTAGSTRRARSSCGRSASSATRRSSATATAPLGVPAATRTALSVLPRRACRLPVRGGGVPRLEPFINPVPL